MVIGSETPESDKKKRKFSMRIKRQKSPVADTGLEGEEVSDQVSSDFFHTRTVSTKKQELMHETGVCL